MLKNNTNEHAKTMASHSSDNLSLPHVSSPEIQKLYETMLAMHADLNALRTQTTPQKPKTALIKDHVRLFLKTRKSENTTRSYTSDLKHFLSFLKQEGINVNEISDITTHHVLLYKDDMAKTLKPTTVARRLSSLKAFFKFCTQTLGNIANPVATIPKPKIDLYSKRFDVLSSQEIFTIIKSAKKHATQMIYEPSEEKERRKAWTRYLVVYLLAQVGMRVSELCSLKIGNFEHRRRYSLTFQAKGTKPHTVPIPFETAQTINQYIAQFRKGASPDEYIFVTHNKHRGKHRPLQPIIVRRMLNRAVKEARLEKKVNPHMLRASLATLLHEKGVPLADIQRLLNHKDLKTTSVYLRQHDLSGSSAITTFELFSALANKD